MKEMLEKLYGQSEICAQEKRYAAAERAFADIFATEEKPMIFSASGRTEIAGNHTDHNRGLVMAAAVSLDVIAMVLPTDDNVIIVQSEGFPEDVVDLSELSVSEGETGTSAALIRGVAAAFSSQGLNIGGFRAYTTSNVLKGSGVSSSAAFEVLIATVLSHLYNDGTVDAVTVAKAARYAENEYFGKPSGLMDQLASAVGGFVAIDFKDEENPVINSIDYDFSASGYSLCIVDTKGSHADLTPDYAAIPGEMRSVAEFFGCEYLREVEPMDLLLNVADVRSECGDRAVLRAFHFFDENLRIPQLEYALRGGDMHSFLGLINQSGISSVMYLQNIYSPADPSNQALSLALAMAEKLLMGRGACRVHGGGFAGTIQAFVPLDILDEFTVMMNNVFGEGSCHILTIRPVGGIRLR